MSEENSFVVDGLRSFDWSSEESVGYEAALEAINEVRALCTGLIEAEQATADPDEQRIVTWQQERAECAALTRRLDPTAHDQVEAVRRDYAARAAELREQHA